MLKKTQELFTLAAKARANAYAPYSKFQVGAALVDTNGQVFTGCNFENASYGGTICAERNAIGAMINAGGRKFTDIVVVTDVEKGCPPCGFCRQVLAEFVVDPDKAMVHVANNKGIVKSYKISELLPHAFDSTYLA